MPSEWRLLEDGITEARHHFAVEEALARLVDEGHTPPTLRLRRVQPAVFVGAYQDTWSEVDVPYCQANGIQIVRRTNGGGAVYQEMGSFCFSAFFSRAMFPQSDEELYHLFAVPAIRTCTEHGIDARFHGRNDVLVGERKIYGSAQLSLYSAFVQSGTFLVNMDFETMARALTPPPLKFSSKPARSIQERVTSLSWEVGRELDTVAVLHRFADHVAEVIKVQLVPGNLTPKEEALAAELLAVKYSTDAWNFGSQREYQILVADRSEEGVLSLSANMQGEVIKETRLTGDLLLPDRQMLGNLQRSLSGITLDQAHNAIQASNFTPGLQASLFRLLSKLANEVTIINQEKAR